MKFKRWSSVLVLALAACEALTLASQKVDLPATKPKDKTEQLVPVEFITPEELKTKIENNEPVAVVDLRGPNLYAQSDKTIKGAVHTKVRKVASRLRAVPRDREIIPYCACPADEAAIIAARTLIANGFIRVRVLKGGWNAWLQAGGQVQPRPK